MRQAQKGRGRKKPRKKTEPLAEGIIVPLDSRGRRGWKSMSDEELVEHARRVIGEKGLEKRVKLKEADGGLYVALRKRKLIDAVGLESRVRDWASMSDEEIVEFARGIVEENKLRKRTELKKADNGLHEFLRKRKLLDRLFPESVRVRRMWSSMGGDEIVKYAHGVIEEKGLKSKGELLKFDAGLHAILGRRNLWDRIRFENKKRSWRSLADDELVEHACGLIKTRELRTRTELREADSGLYHTLWKRGLLDSVGVQNSNENCKSWVSMSNEEIVEHAREVVEKKGLRYRGDLEEADGGLYQVLLRRKLLNLVIPGFRRAKRRNWRFMNDDEVVDYAHGVIADKGVRGRRELYGIDPGLCFVLRKRGLIDAVFAHLESEQRKEAVQEVLDAMKEFDSS